jgi:hypothetical protein
LSKPRFDIFASISPLFGEHGGKRQILSPVNRAKMKGTREREWKRGGEGNSGSGLPRNALAVAVLVFCVVSNHRCLFPYDSLSTVQSVCSAYLQSRGMQSTIYVKLSEGTSVDDIRNKLQKFYEVKANRHWSTSPKTVTYRVPFNQQVIALNCGRVAHCAIVPSPFNTTSGP